jgi:hypothetical protein
MRGRLECHRAALATNRSYRPARPLGEEPACIVDGLAPSLFRHTARALQLKHRPGIDVAFGHAVRSYVFAFLDFGFIGFGRARYIPGYAPNYIVCQLIGFYT